MERIQEAVVENLANIHGRVAVEPIRIAPYVGAVRVTFPSGQCVRVTEEGRVIAMRDVARPDFEVDC